MSDAATDLLRELTLHDMFDAMTRDDATEIAAGWYAIAEENGLESVELDRAAGGDVASYLLQTFGEQGQQLHI